MKVSTTTETITPAMAESWLEKNKENRPVRDDHVAMLAREMAEGRWKLNGEAIVFDYDGNLLDGQHRLWASYDHRLSFDSVVVRGVEPAAFSTIDSGMKRAAGDVLVKAGYGYGTLMASAVRIVHFYETGASNNQIIKRMSNGATLELVRKYPRVEKATALIGPLKRQRRIVAPSAMAALCYYTLEVGEPQTKDFIDAITTGADLGRKDARLIARNYLINQRQAGNRITARTQFALLIKAWNAYIEGRDVGVLKFLDSEEYPVFLHRQKKPLTRKRAA